MDKEKNFIISLILITFVVCTLLLNFGFYTIDESSYFYLTRMIVEKGQFNFDTGYEVLHSQLSRSFLGVVSGDKVYSAFPPGYPFLAVPFYYLFGLKGMQVANVFYTVLLLITFYFFVRGFYGETDAFVASLILLLATQILNYSVSAWSHIPAAFLLLLSLYLLFQERPFLSGLAIGLSMVVRYSCAVIVPVLLGYLYLRDRKTLPRFLAALLIGIAPLLAYNHLAFGSPFVSGMSILNAEEGYSAINLLRLPKALITNLIHYTFFPELELMPVKSALLETSPFLAFSILGAYLFWREKKERRAEFHALAASILIFILFISGTWSLGGFSHNMRLLTDIVPLLTFFAVIPLFRLSSDLKFIVPTSMASLALLYLLNLEFETLKILSISLALASLIAIFALILLRIELLAHGWRRLLSFLLALAIALSVFNALSTTWDESQIRKRISEAAEEFEKTVPEGSVVFIYGFAYPTYTDKDYLFLDYRYSPEDIPRVIAHYKARQIYVAIKEEKDLENFNQFQLARAGPIRTYRLSQASR